MSGGSSGDLSSAIVLEHASRWYGQVIGLNDVSCRIAPGITALLGPNGAGKSTLIKLVTGQLRPTTGGVTVLNQKPFANGSVLARIGYCPEHDSFYEEMSGREFVTQMAALSGISGKTLIARVGEVLERVGMADRCDRKIAGYSKGMRQRIKLAQALVHDPQVLILDEPLNGLDPVGRREVSDLMLESAREGRIVIVSSHILYEVEQLTDHILLIQRGRLLARGTVAGIRDLMDRHPHHIQLRAGNTRALAADLLPLPSVLGLRFDPTDDAHLTVETHRPGDFYANLPELALSGGHQIESMQSPDNSLETVLRYLLAAQTGAGEERGANA